MGTITNHKEILRRLAGRLFTGPIIVNSYRGDYVEELIAAA